MKYSVRLAALAIRSPLAYEKERESLRLEISSLKNLIATSEEQTDHYDQFTALVRKYVDIPELTQTIVNEFVKKIIVSSPDKSSGRRTQQIRIVFNFVGDENIPMLTAAATVE